MILKRFLIILFGLSFFCCASADSKSISIKEVQYTSASILLVNDAFEIFGIKDSVAIFIPICFELQNYTGKDIKFEFHLIGKKDPSYPIAQLDNSIFIHRNDLDNKNYFETNNKNAHLYTLFCQSEIWRSDLDNIQLKNSKKLSETIKYIPVDVKNHLGKTRPSLVIHVKFIKRSQEYNLYYYTGIKKSLIINYNSVIKYASEKNDTTNALELAQQVF